MEKLTSFNGKESDKIHTRNLEINSPLSEELSKLYYSASESRSVEKVFTRKGDYLTED